MRTRRIPSLCILAMLPTAAHAGALATSLVFAGSTQVIGCVLTNVGTRAARIAAVEARDVNGGVIAPFFSSCGTTLDPGKSCAGTTNLDVDAWCSFDVRGKVRGSIVVYENDGSGPVVALPATKK